MRITTKDTHDGTKFVLTVDGLDLLAIARHAREAGAQYEKEGRPTLAKEAYELDEVLAGAYAKATYGEVSA